MKKNKLLKTLLVLVMSMVMAFAAFGFTACKPDSEGDNNHTNEGDDNGNGDNNGDNNGNGDGNGDNEGDNNGDGNGDNEGDTTPDPENTVIYKLDIGDLETKSYPAGELVAGSKISITGELPVSENNKKSTYLGEEISLTKRIQITNGKAKMLKVEVDKKATVVVYSLSGSNGTERSLQLVDVDGKVLETAPQTQSVGDGNDIFGVTMFNVESGTHYIASVKDGVNVYCVAIISNLKESVTTTVEAVPATCLEKGSSAHYISNFGRYFSDEALTARLALSGTIVTKALGHDYTATPVYVNPTETQTGTATVECSRKGEDATHENKVVTLPTLDSAVYTRTQSETDEGSYVYTATIDGVAISFEAVKVEKATISASKAIMYFTDGSTSVVNSFNTANSSWVVDNSIISNPSVYKGTGAASLYAPSNAPFTSVYDNGTPDDTSDDVNVPAAIKMESSTGFKFTAVQNVTITIYYTYKTDAASNSSIKVNGGTAFTLANGGTTNAIQSATYTDSLTAGTEYTITRGSNEVEILYFVFEVV